MITKVNSETCSNVYCLVTTDQTVLLTVVEAVL